MTISFRLNETDTDIIKAYAKMRGMTVSELIRGIVMEHIEEKSDLQEYEKACAAYKKDPETFALDDVIKELDLA
ncbi:type II toxin-antitoxin system RelB family antitoxin [Succinimonas sp.]|uniref:type II toxin-antitoxin system RelB family antitoxin n=1 Tax=Succinimonas sp. TaxID=1936151 RepID=UPI003863FE15